MATLRDKIGMPYANPEEGREAKRRRYRERLETERGFRRRESERKAAYYASNRRYREGIKAAALERYYEGRVA